MDGQMGMPGQMMYDEGDNTVAMDDGQMYDMDGEEPMEAPVEEDAPAEDAE
jgi:hypothetical protein